MQGIGIVLFTLGGKNLKRALRGLTDVLDKTVVVNDGKDIKLGVSEEKKIKKFINKKTKLKALYYCTDDDDPMGKFNNVRLTVDLGDNELTLNMGTSGSLVYLHKDVFRKCGFFDERYRAAVEWSDFSYRLSQQNLSTPFLWFPHVKSVSDKLIVSDNNVMYEESMEDRIIRGMKLFYMKYKCQIQDLIDTYSKKDVISKLKNKSRTS